MSHKMSQLIQLIDHIFALAETLIKASNFLSNSVFEQRCLGPPQQFPRLLQAVMAMQDRLLLSRSQMDLVVQSS